jgi:hypothetical protein
MGRTNERIARTQETYVANATTGWLESLERSLAMMKEYQVCQPAHNVSTITNFLRLLERSLRIADLPTMLPSRRCRKPRKRISELRRNFALKKLNTRNLVRMFYGACKISRRPKQIVLLILERSWMQSLSTMTDVAMSSFVSREIGLLGMFHCIIISGHN